MGKFLSAIGGWITKVESWWSFVRLMVGAGFFTWLGRNWELIASQGWAATVFIALLATAVVSLAGSAVVASIASLRRSREKPIQASISSPDHRALAEAIAAASARKKPEPIFGCPVQKGPKHHVSWWYIPISVEGDGSSPNAEIKHCTVELFSPAIVGEPIQLRWKSDTDWKGKEEEVLVEGIYRMVAVAVRCEARSGNSDDANEMNDGVARITGAAFLRDENFNKFPLEAGRVKFKIRVRSGKKSWVSPHFYSLTIPQNDQSNGHFILSTVLP